jgi:hypothetical protein
MAAGPIADGGGNEAGSGAHEADRLLMRNSSSRMSALSAELSVFAANS